MERNLTAADICAAAGCKPSTLRAWRNRNGLFPQVVGDGWTRYDLAEAIGARIVQLLSERGFAAQPSVNLVNQMREILINAARGYAPFIGIGRALSGEHLEFKVFSSTGLVLDSIGWFTDPVVTVLDLNSFSIGAVSAIRDHRDSQGAEQ